MAQKAVTDQQKVLADRKKQVDDAKKASDALTKQVGEAQDRLRKAADDAAKAAAQTEVDKAKKDLEEKQKARKDLEDAVKKDAADWRRSKSRWTTAERKEGSGPGQLKKLTDELAVLVQDMDKARKDLVSQARDLDAAGRATPIDTQLFDAEGDPIKDPLPPPDKAHLAEGRRIFSERGCLACHVHDGVRERRDGVPAVPDEAADFAPDLSRVADKIAPKTGDAARTPRPGGSGSCNG